MKSGFNPDRVETELTSLNNTWTSIENVLVTNAQSFVTTMSAGWFEGKAITFFSETYKPTIEKMFTTVQSQLSNIFSVVNSAGEAHNTTSDVAHFSKVAFNGESNSCSMDVSSIIDISPEGFVGILDATFNAAETTLLTMINDLDTAFVKMVEDFSDIAFEGGAHSLQATLQSSLTSISTSFKGGFETIITGFNDALGGVKTVHEDLAESTNTAFTISE